MINLYAPDRVRIWLYIFQYQGDGELELEEVDEVHEHGEVPDWLPNDIHETGLGDVLQLVDEEDMLNFLLEHGVAPGQAFQIEFERPRWYRCGEYDSDWDVDYDWTLVDRKPMSERDVLASWESYLATRKG